MHSPLPDASALEAGILEDETPSRLSRVQDNVRNLLRTSRFGSVHSSPLASPTHQPHLDHGLSTPPDSPTRRTQHQQPEVLPSPSAESSTSTSTTSTPPPQTGEVRGVLFPPASYQRAVQQMAHQSALFNTRAVAALNHPDLSDPTLAVYVQQHKAEGRQRRAWTRSRHGRKRHVAASAGSSQCLLCVLAALLLSAIIATYIVLATSSGEVTPTFHVLFILGILLATIVFAHSLFRIFLLSDNSRGSVRRVVILPPSRAKHRRHRREHHQHHQPRIMPAVSNDAAPFIPATPIPVHMPADEVRPDTREAQPTATATVEDSPADWDKDVEAVANPPPAYGRWRGSVRANPDLLHWQAVRSPVDSDAAELPSPTYEEAMLAQRTGPPSYVTRESPARQRVVRQASAEAVAAEAQAQTADPEMVEGRGIGLGV